MTEQAKVPAIRFAGFTDPWEQRKLGELSSEFQSGDFISAEEILGSGPYPVYGGNGLRGYAKQYNHDGFYALIGRQGALCGNVNTAVGKAYFTEHAVAVKANFLHDTRFLAHLLGCMDLGRYSGQSAQPGLAVGVLKEVETTVPSKAEQQAIGSFFSRLDSLITLHQRKYDKLVIFKKSMLEKMFPKDGESVPEIRFAGFTDPWEQRKLGDIAERVTRKNENNESDLPLTISAQHGLIDQRLFFNAQVASRDMSGYYLLRQGEFAYNKSTSADSPWGAIKRLTRYEKGCVSTLYICFALLNANPDYLVTYYETNRWHKAVQMIAAEGARNHGLLNIAPDDFFDTMVSLPESQAEQQTIGAFFSRLDSLITLHQRKLELLQNIKKSLLDKMFV
ncbi:restriction endonuclease subunit S [Bifidobacterium longum]|uniref:restriction endonuclease subunit S n=2 Tax=Bifidobacterium longum TaxID=216816 RepID=UPI0006BCC2AC|nr:type I restriction modification DNA specificity domain protein [Bifidobacterium longum]MBK5041431.1 restriction endonuclease subunit S [Bifidobacterium longum subsp. longum]KAB7290442.1 restriction endonuclease subunit S [Bifidobacterium longum]KAB7319533.1 restriction endonuclease subunit S [Bifidobacterium longum]PKD08579.1 restriction endonuclease S subunit [Bifidobacterium longum]